LVVSVLNVEFSAVLFGFIFQIRNNLIRWHLKKLSFFEFRANVFKQNERELMQADTHFSYFPQKSKDTA